jgi:hypothetical protein
MMTVLCIPHAPDGDLVSGLGKNAFDLPGLDLARHNKLIPTKHNKLKPTKQNKLILA